MSFGQILDADKRTLSGSVPTNVGVKSSGPHWDTLVAGVQESGGFDRYVVNSYAEIHTYLNHVGTRPHCLVMLNGKCHSIFDDFDAALECAGALKEFKYP